MDPERLVDLEEIKQLKARYFRLMDEKNWDAWADVFTVDCTMENGAPGHVTTGRSEIVAYVRRAVAHLVTVHHGHMPEIAFESGRDATGVWALYDLVEGKGYRMEGWGHYHDRYRRCDDGRWRIGSTRLTRLRVDASDPAIQDLLWPEGRELRTW